MAITVTLSVIILISMISFYDYFSARKWQQVTSSTRNDIVFEHRNKEYGAYVIRRDYDKKIVLILLSLCLLIGGTFGTYKFIQNLPEEVIEEAPVDMTQFDLPAAPLEEEVPPPIEEPPPPMEETLAFPEPVVEDDQVETELAIADELEETKAAETTQEGEGEFILPVEEVHQVAEVEKIEVVETYVDEEALFPGGRPALEAFMGKNVHFPDIAIEERLSGKSYIGFVVDREGNISNITVKKGMVGCPECDKEAIRVVKLMPKWKPGKLNGKDVKSSFILPFNFKVQE